MAAVTIAISQFARRVPAALAAALDVPRSDVRVPGSRVTFPTYHRLDAAGQHFAVECHFSNSPGTVAQLARRALGVAKSYRQSSIPLVVVPYMTQVGRDVCREAGVSWLDLSGNAYIVGPGLRVILDGHRDQFRGRGRPATIFAPKSARISRWLLMHPEASFAQRQIAQATEMTEGYVSRIVKRLEQERYVVRGPDGRVRAEDPDLLLDAWREAYDFSKHRIVQGHVAARSGEAAARFVGDTLAAEKIEHAATGLAAAWQWTHFAAFRIATFFVGLEPSEALQERLAFREDERGANVWLVVPNDVGVFHGAAERDGVRCVHPVQAYLDLKGHPERAPEAAARLRNEQLKWRRRG